MSRSEATPLVQRADACSSISIRCRSTPRPDAAKPLRMPVQWVNRPNQNFRGFSGQIASGAIGPGAEVRILPSGRIDPDRRAWSTARRRSRRSRRRPVGHAHPRRRSRLLARRRDRRGRRSARSRRPVRSDDRVDGRGRASARPRLLDEARHADRHRDGPGAQVRDQRQHARASRGHDARAQRHRRRRDRDRPRDRVRALCGRRRRARTRRSAASS